MKMDIAVILIFALTIFFTMRKGFVSTIAGFLKGIASVAAAYFLAGPLGKFIEGTSVGAATEFRISEQFSSRLGSSDTYNSLPGILNTLLPNLRDVDSSHTPQARSSIML